MTIRIFWELDAADRPDRAEPSRRPDWSESIRDGRTARGNRAHHYGQIARAAALTGFDGLFFTYRPESDDSQILAASVGRLVPTLELVPEFPASVGSAVYAAKEAVSFQRATHNRLGWAIAPERSAAERRSDGDPVSDEDGLARLEEFLTVARGVHGTRGYDFKGRFFEVEKGGFDEPLSRAPFPQVYLRGLGEELFGLSARQADVHVFDDLPIADLRAHIETLDGLAERAGRRLDYAQRLSLFARETAEDVAATGEPADLSGTYDAVAEALAQRADLGVTHLILRASPSLEEAYRIGEFVLPRLRALLAPRRVAA